MTSRILLMSALLGSFLSLSACTQKKDLAKEVAEDFLTHFFCGEFDRAREVAHPNLYAILDESQAILDELTPTEQEEVRAQLKTALITVEATPFPAKGDTLRYTYHLALHSDAVPQEAAIYVCKEGRGWKVLKLE